ncbi:hypothetical protein KP509_1Z259600 [Ceratopteris richardii]|nr:hypothetical protein KP509_1Z259600 [Ceratopteris richardii]
MTLRENARTFLVRQPSGACVRGRLGVSRRRSSVDASRLRHPQTRALHEPCSLMLSVTRRCSLKERMKENDLQSTPTESQQPSFLQILQALLTGVAWVS